jgi:hypothetical protein
VRGTEAWDDAMVKARGQAERYVRALPASEPNAPTGESHLHWHRHSELVHGHPHFSDIHHRHSH